MIKRPFAGLVPGALDQTFAIGHGTRHTTANFVVEGEQMCDRIGIHESIQNFFLGHDAHRILSSDCHHRQSTLCRFETIFHLIQTSLRRKDGNVMIIIAVCAVDVVVVDVDVVAV